MRESTRPVASVGFDRSFDGVMIVLCAWFQFGVYLDGWAHLRFPELETFSTPWHAVLYSGFLAASAWIVAALIRSRARGSPWRQTLPAGYGLSLLGVAIFLVGGVADMGWHISFGVEVDVDALASPTHLMMGLGSALIFAGPLRAAWRRSGTDAQGWVPQIPMILSLALLLSTFTFFTAYAHPLARPWIASGNRPTLLLLPLEASDPPIRGSLPAAASLGKSLGLSSMLLQTAISMGIILLAMRRGRWFLPAGTLTIVFGINGILMGFMRGQMTLVPAVVLAGIIGDVLLAWLRPSAARPGALRAFAFSVPAVYYALHFASVALSKGSWWSAHMVGGSIILTGITGWLVSYLVISPEAKSLTKPSLAQREAPLSNDRPPA